MKNLLRKILDSEPIEILAVGFIILFLGGMLFMLSGCELVEFLTGTTGVANDTVKAIDQDGSGVISMQEIIAYLIGYDMVKGGGIAGAKKIRNGRRRNGQTSSESSDSRSQL